MTRMTATALSLVLAVAAGFAWGAEGPSMGSSSPGSKEFQEVAKLAGKWVGTATESDGKTSPVTVEYRVTSAGSAVEEHLMPGTPHEMVDMYYDEGGGLVMTHYCALGNRPRMVVKQASPGIDAAKDRHMHSLVLEYADADHLIQRWTSYSGGALSGSVVFTLTREK